MPPEQQWHRKKRYFIPLSIVGGIAVLLVGVAIGAAGKPSAAVETVHQPSNPAPTVNSDGSIDLHGVSVNELGSARGPVATYAYGDGGKHYFIINTEGCSWSLAVVTG